MVNKIQLNLIGLNYIKLQLAWVAKSQSTHNQSYETK